MQRFSGLTTLLVGIVASVLAFWWLRQPRALDAAPDMRPPHMVPVTLVAPERGDLTPSVPLTGNVRAPDRADLGFLTPGRIVRIDVRDADRVEAGQKLAALDQRDAEQGLERARAEHELARAELALLEAGSRAEEIAELEAELSSAEAEVVLAVQELERSATLLEGRVTSQSAYDRLVAERDAAQGRARAAEQRLATARAGSRAEDLAIARARVAARAVEVRQAEIQLAKHELIAPFDGVVVAKLRSVGDYVSVGETVLDLFDPSRIEDELEVPASVLSGLREAGRVLLDVGGPNGEALEADLSALVPAADPASRNFRALVRLEGDEARTSTLLPGSFVRADVRLATLQGVWIVPGDALLVNDSGRFLVRAIDAPPAERPSQGPPPPPWVAEWVPVEVLGREGARAAVRSLGPPLDASDRIVRTGVDNAFPGTPLLPAAVSGGPRGGPPGGPTAEDPAAQPSDDASARAGGTR